MFVVIIVIIIILIIVIVVDYTAMLQCHYVAPELWRELGTGPLKSV